MACVKWSMHDETVAADVLWLVDEEGLEHHISICTSKQAELHWAVGYLQQGDFPSFRVLPTAILSKQQSLVLRSRGCPAEAWLYP